MDEQMTQLTSFFPGVTNAIIQFIEELPLEPFLDVEESVLE